MDLDHAHRWELPPEVRESVLSRVRPTLEERQRIEEASIALVESVERAAEDAGLDDVRCILSGSVAKGTYMKDPDLDLFILFRPGTDLDTMKAKGLETAGMVLQNPQMSYAQHPYMTGKFMDLTVDIVPGIDIPEGARVVTAVDRTQHHTRYINTHLNMRARDDVLLLKAFLKGIGAYGAEDTANGFSGYLSELLVLWKGGLGGVIGWLGSIPRMMTPPSDMEELGMEHLGPGPAAVFTFSDPVLRQDHPHPLTHYMSHFAKDALVIVDPTDRERNVASPVSAQTLSHAAACASLLVQYPSEGMFHPFSRRPRDLSSHPAGSLDGALMVPLPEGNPSRIASQMRKSLNHLTAGLLREGFSEASVRYIYAFARTAEIDQAYLKSRATWTGDMKRNLVLLWIDAEPSRLEWTYRHWGPPLEHRQTAHFRERWKGRPVLEEGGRSYVELTRTKTDPVEIAIDLWEGIGHGPDLSGSMLCPFLRTSRTSQAP